MVIAGLTGGIASGKSTVAHFLKEAGARIVCADRIAHQVMEPGLPAWHQIIEHFGREILGPDEQIDRKRLGDIIFNDPVEKAELENITHPAVFAAMDRAVAACANDDVVILDVPLLIETGMQRGLEHVIVVYIPEELQLERLMARDGLSETDARARIAAQMPLDEKRRYATFLIENSGSLAQTRSKTLQVFDLLKNAEK